MIHIYTGNGKGKTTAGIGLCIRCSGYNKKVAVFQFLKTSSCGEYKALHDKFDFYYSDTEFGFVYNMTDDEKQIAHSSTYRLFLQFIELCDDYDIVMLDEVISAVNVGFIDIKYLLSVAEKFKTMNKELILTGRDPSDKLVNVADYVSEIKSVKHPYDFNVQAREGIEF